MTVPVWSLVLDAARELGAGGAMFSRADLLAAVTQRDPDRRADSVGPVIQGMTSNATGGVPCACGTPLVRVAHGWYRLAAPQPNQPSTAGRPGLLATGGAVPGPAVDPPARAELVLVGCVKTKVDHAAAARDLYVSPLFQRRRHYAEHRGERWYILSAEHGLLHPDALVEPYDTALAEQSERYRRAWGRWVLAKLLRIEGDLHGRVIEIHAGDAYVAPLRELLREAGAVARYPLAGLPIGAQLSWYSRPPMGQADDPEPDDSGEPAPAPAPAPFADMTVLDGPTPTRPFTYRWPDTSESFDAGWTLTVAHRGQHYPIRVGLCVRPAYGHDRRRLVAWINGDPVAEAVAEDDFPATRSLVGLLKEHRRMLRPGDRVPAAYTGFPIVAFLEHVHGPSARNGLAVRMPESDITGWAAFAVARLAARAQPDTDLDDPAEPTEPVRPTEPAEPTEPAGPIVPTAPAVGAPAVAAPPPGRAPVAEPDGRELREAVVAAILSYGRNHQEENVGRPPQFTPHPDANQLIIDDPFAFLLAVIFDQGIPAERAWRAPYDLKLRLGHLDPARLASQPADVAAAVARAPALHRFTTHIPQWLVGAAARVVEQYHGDAGAIWRGEPRATTVAMRLRAFDGIGQKKSAMAVEILARDLRVPIRDLSGSDIAYDIHIRRVFLRTGLADYDDLDHIVDMARTLHPRRPGELDLPTWLIGRRWCGPGTPDCAGCALGAVCPRHIDRGSGLYGG